MRHNEEVEAAINAAITAQNKAQKPRSYLGASRWGHHCERALGYEYHQTPKDEGRDFSPNILRIFNMGHDGEARMADHIRAAGFDLQTHLPSGEQIGFKAADGRLAGHCDGIIHSGPDLGKLGARLNYPLVWENKELNDKSWNDTKNKGLAESKPLYYSQVQTYIAYFDLNGGLFTAVNRNTGEVYVEVVDPDLENAQASTDKAVRVIQSSSPSDLAKATTDRTDYRCKFCDYQKTCWAPLHAKPTAPAAWVPSLTQRKR